MVKSIPNWVMERYSVLYRKLKCKQFTREEARTILENFGIYKNDKLTNTFFSELNHKGWVEVKKDPQDTRRKIFKLKSPENAILNLEIEK